MDSVIAWSGIVLAGLVVLAGLTYICTRVATRNERDDPAIRGAAAAMSLLGAVVALGNIAFVFAGTIIGADTDTYSGRQVLYLELSLTASYVLLAGFTLAGRRLIRRTES